MKRQAQVKHNPKAFTRGASARELKSPRETRVAVPGTITGTRISCTPVIMKRFRDPR